MKNTSGLPEKRKRVEKREESRVGKKIEPRGRWKREHQRRKEEIKREGEREKESWNQTIIETEKERTSTRGWKKGRSSRPRG